MIFWKKRKTTFAKEYIESHYEGLNAQLFDFVQEQRVDGILCTSWLVGSYLPEPSSIEDASVGRHLIYRIREGRTLDVWIINHPSSYGFKPYVCREFLEQLVVFI